MLPRRAPREVYRVYGHEEFLAAPASPDAIEVGRVLAGERRLQRLAGTAVLLAAMGAVAGVVAATGLPPGSPRRHRAVLAVRLAGMPERPDVWQQRRTEAAGHSPVYARRPMTRRTRGARAGRRIRAGAQVLAATGRHDVALEAARVAGSATPSRVSAPMSVARLSGGSQLSAMAVAASRQSGQVEFGFER
jgi:hypothetical protein